MPLRRFRRQYEQLLQFEMGRIIGMMKAGWSAARITRQLGRFDCVMRCCNQGIREMSFTRRLGSERPRQTSRREDRHIVRNARVQPTASSATIHAQVAPSLGVPVFSRTIQRSLAEGHLGSRRSLRVLPLTPTHRRLRLEWCHARKNRTAAKWKQVIFSDESRINLSSDDNRARVWRPRGERLNPTFALQRHTAPTAGVMVWGTIAYNTRSPLVLIRGTLTAQRYIHAILQPHVFATHATAPKSHFSTRQGPSSHGKGGGHKTVSALLLPFLGLHDPQIFHQSSISGIIWDDELGIPRV
ncbi:transposable element Tcb2 transposase [Trichonephila clavipes]|nr:transposable element Tcb2 transposase [Trichonephila clavipes]